MGGVSASVQRKRHAYLRRLVVVIDYNNLDVAPGLEALEKMRTFYIEKGIDILKYAVSVPGVSLHYLLRGWLSERGRGALQPGRRSISYAKSSCCRKLEPCFHKVHVTIFRSSFCAEQKYCQIEGKPQNIHMGR